MLGGGAYYDVREHRIPNWWVFTAIAAGMALCAVRAGEGRGAGAWITEEFWFLFRMVIVVCALFVLYICRMIGAGDIKLAALMCGYLGLRDGSLAVFLGFLAGAVWSFLKLTARGSLAMRMIYLSHYVRRVLLTKEVTAYYSPKKDGYGGTIPLGVCLFAGTAFLMMAGLRGQI